ncbi:PAS domain-containing sensor histidine kinase [Aromatoleum bremense]|uniref:histidine kinase n=1 Tax=Aromatoleum bremense TaxID=76115 RepID=A0ABX1NYP5_9RHOO|nr:PAS domain S-box protein [Aromatoleum bremense]NMG17174.1 PAS domain S-box protein [Aromatoleum bremense]QTQ30010.1 Two component system sensor histidine kinase [Aromatoleum bremense]
MITQTGSSTNEPDEEIRCVAHEADIPFDLIFDNAFLGICIMRNRQFVKVNPKMELMFGYGPGELTGKSVRVVYASEDDYDSIGKLYPTFARNHGYVYENPLVRKNGEIFWCLISGHVVSSDPTRSSVWIVQDIDARKTAENQLNRSKERLAQVVERRTINLQRTNHALKEEVVRRRNTEREMLESREKYRALFRHIPMGILATDDAGNVIEINPAIRSMTGTSTLEDFERVACDPTRVITEDGQLLSLNQLIHSKSPHDGRRVERAHIHWRTASGTLAEYDVSCIRLAVRGLGAAFVFEDTTEQSRARQREHEQQQRLAHAARLALMGQFASALAHELGQPLNSCRSYLAGLQHRFAPELSSRPEWRDVIDRVDLHLEQAGDIVRNVRSFVAHHRPDDTEIHLSTLIAQTLDLLRLQLRDEGVQVRVHARCELPPVRGNRVELQQVLINLMVNALDAMRDTPIGKRVIEIRLSRESQSQVAVRLSDSGVGIPADACSKIYEPYYTTKPDGLGLGLMMCRTILESHGGNLKLIPTSRGGATFKFVLPSRLAVNDEEEENGTASSEGISG